MPRLQLRRWENFAQIIASGSFDTYGDAYMAAGFPAGSRGARNPRVRAQRDGHRLAQHPKIKARVSELQELSRASEFSEDHIVRELVDILARAKTAGKLAVAVSAVREIGVMTGLRVERSEVKREAELDQGKLAQALLQVLEGGMVDITPQRSDPPADSPCLEGPAAPPAE